MPEGPFGLPRFTSIGPFVEQDLEIPDDNQAALRDIQFRPHSIRNYDPREFRLLLDAGVERHELMKVIRSIEGERFDSMLDEAHRFFRALDEDERQGWARNNPGFMQWLNVWATLEEVQSFEEYEDLDGILS